MTRLVTERLVLRAAQEDDLAPLFAIYGNPQAMRYWSTLPHETPEDTRPLLNALMRPGPRLYFALDLDGRVIGTAGIHEGDEIGFILHPDHWRKGLMREAVGAIIAHVWAATALPRITADADPLNTASVGFLRALGFRETGRARDTFCIAGQWSDSVYFALDRPTGTGTAGECATG